MAIIADTKLETAEINTKEIREFLFEAVTVADTTSVLDTEGYDYAFVVVGAGTDNGTGTTTYTMLGLDDAAGTTAASIPEEAGFHKCAVIGTTAVSRVCGYLSRLPRFLKFQAVGGDTSSVSLHVYLRKGRVLDRGR